MDRNSGTRLFCIHNNEFRRRADRRHFSPTGPLGIRAQGGLRANRVVVYVVKMGTRAESEVSILESTGSWLKSLRAIGWRLLPSRVKRLIKTISPDPDTSQAGEAAILEKLVEDFVCEDWVIDVGANDGVAFSNSLAFVRRGWHSVLIEPAPAVFRKLVANHGHLKNVTCLEVACCENAGETDLYIGSDGEEGFLSTLSKANNEWFDKTRTSQSVEVKTDTLTNILANQKVPGRPGILLVDCEGMDYEVLLGLDLVRFRPTIIVTEEYEWEPSKHAAKYDLLIHANYSLFQKVGCNTIWIDRTAVRRPAR
jgi:FkbM family methyltransferase